VTPRTTPEFEEKFFELDKKLESKRQENRDLANIASVITSLLDIESVLAATMEIGIRRAGGEVGAVLQVIDNKAQVKVAWGVDTVLLESLKYRNNLNIIDYCLQSRRTVYDNDCRDKFPGRVTIHNFVCVPITARDKIFGAMVIFNKRSGSGFDEKDIAGLELICKFASVAIENSILLKESLEKQKIDQELDLGRQVQANFLPGKVSIPGLEIAASYIPARQVGGDYYDLIPLDEDRLFFLIGDVTNKGVPAALVMTSVYSIVRSYVTGRERFEVPALMAHLNDSLCSNVIKSHGMFITLFMAVIDLERGYLEYCNGGHPPPFYLRSGDGEIVPLKRGGPIVGQFPGTSYISDRVEIDRGDRLFCYTDGLVEATDREGRLYGLKRLERYVREHGELGTEDFSLAVKRAIDDFSRGGSEEAIDDYTTLVIDIKAGFGGGRNLEFSYPSHLDSLEKLYKDIENIFEGRGFPEAFQKTFTVAVSEAVTNAIVHAHGQEPSKKIRFTVDLNDERIIASVLDRGQGDRAIAIDTEGTEFRLDAEGGRGIGLIKKLSDKVSFKPLAGGGMEVRIVKYLPQDKSDGGTYGNHR